MNDPWQFLILDRNTATERDVKSAYARLLKQHRPDQDPEGFQKLRGAYEAALASLASGVTMESPGVADAPTGVPARDVPELQSSPVLIPRPSEMVRVDEALAKVRASISTRIRQKVREALQEFDVAASQANLPAAERTQLLAAAFGAEMKLFAEICSNDRLIQHVTEGDAGLAHTVIGIWSQESETKRLLEFAEAIQRHYRKLADASGATLMMHVAAALGRWHPQFSTELANKAFGHLPPDQREALNRTVDNEVALGRIFEGFPLEHRTFWYSWISGKEQRCNWRDSYSRQMLHVVMTQRGSQWAGFAVLQKFMPPQAWQDLVSAIRMFYR